MTDGADTPTTQTINLEIDLGASFDAPIGWDHIEEFFMN